MKEFIIIYVKRERYNMMDEQSSQIKRKNKQFNVQINCFQIFLFSRCKTFTSLLEDIYGEE